MHTEQQRSLLLAAIGTSIWFGRYCVFNYLPCDKILTLTKLKAFADDKFTVPRITISVFDRVENTVGNGEIFGYQHFLLFPKTLSKALCSIRLN